MKLKEPLQMARCLLGVLLTLAAAPARAQQSPPFGPEFQVNTVTTYTQSGPVAASDGHGNFVVVWSGDKDGSYSVFAQIYDGYGSKVGSEFPVNTSNGFGLQLYGP